MHQHSVASAAGTVDSSRLCSNDFKPLASTLSARSEHSLSCLGCVACMCLDDCFQPHVSNKFLLVYAAYAAQVRLCAPVVSLSLHSWYCFVPGCLSHSLRIVNSSIGSTLLFSNPSAGYNVKHPRKQFGQHALWIVFELGRNVTSNYQYVLSNTQCKMHMLLRMRTPTMSGGMISTASALVMVGPVVKLWHE